MKFILQEATKLNEMVYDLSKAKKIVEGLGETFRVHLSYLFILGKTYPTYQHWRNELYSYCKTIDNMQVKTKSKKIDEDIIIDNLTWHIDTTQDAKAFVEYSWEVHNGELPNLDNLNNNDYISFRLFMNELYDELPSILCSIDDHSKEFFQEYFDDKINKFER